MIDDDQIRISETVDRSDPLTVDVVLEVHETIASVQEVDGFVRVRFRVPVAEWDAVLGRRKIQPATDPTRKQIEAYLRQSPPWECDGGCWHYGPDSYEASFYLDEPAPVVVGKIATAEGRTPAEVAARITAPPSPTITYPEQKPPPSHPVQVVRGTAQAVAGLTFPAADDDEPIRIGEVVAASDPGIVHVTVNVSKTVANVTETQDGRFVLWMAIPREAWPGKI